MTDNNHPITPPPELVNQWCNEGGSSGITSLQWFQIVATQAARWGADMELVACMDYVDNNVSGYRARALRAARRPKPSLKEQALEALDQADNGLTEYEWPSRHDIIRRALESLP